MAVERRKTVIKLKKQTIIALGLGLLFILVEIFLFYKFTPEYQASELACSGPNCLKVITWGSNTTTHEKQLGATGFRHGCSSKPESCVKSAENFIAVEDPAKSDTLISMASDPTKVADYATKYSSLSIGKSWLKEVGIDDFIGVYSRWIQTTDATTLLNTTIDNLKNSNNNLDFGVTLYEDEVNGPLVQDASLPKLVRDKIDAVHLYVHYRQNGPNYRSYVEQTKILFPNAKIYAGVYNYDRIDYSPCHQVPFARPIDNSLKCTLVEELSLFEQTTRVQVDMLAKGEVSALEFFPGIYDNDNIWKYFRDPDPVTCSPERKQECIDNTIRLEDSAIMVLNQYRSGSLVTPSSIIPNNNTSSGADTSDSLYKSSSNINSTQPSGTVNNKKSKISAPTLNQPGRTTEVIVEQIAELGLRVKKGVIYPFSDPPVFAVIIFLVLCLLYLFLVLVIFRKARSPYKPYLKPHDCQWRF